MKRLEEMIRNLESEKARAALRSLYGDGEGMMETQTERYAGLNGKTYA